MEIFVLLDFVNMMFCCLIILLDFLVVNLGSWLILIFNLIVGGELLLVVLVLNGVKMLGWFLMEIFLLFGVNIFWLVIRILLV